MALARMRKICVDAVDPAALAGFWAEALDYRLVVEDSPEDEREAGLVDAAGVYRLWFNRVPQQKSVKHRVHLDIYSPSLADLEALGATVVLPEGDDRRWTVMTDPEDGEFCAFLRDDLPERRLHGMVVDCSDAPAQSRWWYDVLGGRNVEEQGWGTVADVPELPAMTFDFVPVPEPKTAANRIHWDVDVESIDPLLQKGATLLRPKGDDGIRWHVLADPEGNVFCLLRRQVPA
jgi:hypothetical protein